VVAAVLAYLIQLVVLAAAQEAEQAVALQAVVLAKTVVVAVRSSLLAQVVLVGYRYMLVPQVQEALGVKVFRVLAQVAVDQDTEMVVLEATERRILMQVAVVVAVVILEAEVLAH
jgi:hypothetical protein